MKKITNTLMCAGLLLAAVLSINSCQKPSGEGSGVRFRARTFSSPLTKTEYGGAIGGKELINWVSGDQLMIACAQCTPTSADYRVTGTITSDGAISEADALTPVSGNGLQWGTGSHTFYAVYPASKASFTAEGEASASLPSTQGGADTATSSSTSEGVTTVSMVPDMSNAFMYASEEVDEPGSDVELTFKPMFTAFQFTVGGDGTGGDVTLKSVDLISTSCALSGSFSLDIGSTTYTIPDREENTNDKITYTFPANTKINTDKKVCFTLFVQPTSKITGNANLNGTAGVISDLTIRFTLGDNTTRALKLKYDASTHGGNFVDFPGGHKINITGLTLPTQLKSWSFTVLKVGDWGSDTPDVLYGSPDVVDPGSDTPDVLYGSPEVVEPGEGWIAETFAPDVNDLVWDWYDWSLGFAFSVSSTGDKVRFSPGNLQAVFAAPGTSFTWKFADNQWSYVGANAANTSISGNGEVPAAGTVDLFGWSTSATKYGIHNSTDVSDYSGDFVDWGSDPNLIDALGSGWRALTSAEWGYLLFTRSGNRFCKAKVNSVPGLVIFPDEYSHPSGVTAPASVNTKNTAFTSNTWSGDAWTKMESAGCVFLPAAGSRSGTSVKNVGSDGNYWSSSPSDYNPDDSSSYQNINNVTMPLVNYNYRYWGFSVRLVRNL